MNGAALAYIPDHEPVLGVEIAGIEPEWISGHALAERVDLLLHDCQFSEIEYPSRIGWGHSVSVTQSSSPSGPRLVAWCCFTMTRTARTTASTGSWNAPETCGATTREMLPLPHPRA